jgi:serine-type D-Ala-D-Ala carboxypeptidase/endopeptidase (penicillin-binding protein 4)
MGGQTTADSLPTRAGVRSTLRRTVPAALLLWLLVAALACGAILCPPPAAAAVDASIAAALRSAGLGSSSAGVYVWDLDAARLVYEHDATTGFAPASNLKLVTSAAALRYWTAAHRFSTELYVPDAPVGAGGVLRGDVYLRGLGDPSLSTKAYQHDLFDLTTASFESLARTLKNKGVKKITGHVLGDASWFDGLKVVPYWKSGLQLECGPLSALSGDQGLDDGNRVKAPATWAAGLMTTALKRAGIRVKGAPGTGLVPPTARLVKRQYSATLPRILRYMNQESDNFFAEMLLKGLGKDFYGEGSTAAGTQASAATLQAMGVETGTYVIEDGSGLSYGDRLTAKDIVTVLGAVRQRDDFESYYDSLAVAGESGTLEDRMRGTAAAGNAHAKTGTLNIAVCLSGYVESANGHLVAFSILMNGEGAGTSGWEQATKAQDKMVAALAGASLPGETVLAATPVLRQHSVSAFEPVYGTGGRLEPVVEP